MRFLANLLETLVESLDVGPKPLGPFGFDPLDGADENPTAVLALLSVDQVNPAPLALSDLVRRKDQIHRQGEVVVFKEPLLTNRAMLCVCVAPLSPIGAVRDNLCPLHFDFTDEQGSRSRGECLRLRRLGCAP